MLIGVSSFTFHEFPRHFVINITSITHLYHDAMLVTVVLTTVWCEFMADPNLFRRKFVISRDHKFIAVGALFLGGFVGRAILDQVGSAGAFGVGTGFRVLIAIGWLFVPAKKASPK